MHIFVHGYCWMNDGNGETDKTHFMGKVRLMTACNGDWIELASLSLSFSIVVPCQLISDVKAVLVISLRLYEKSILLPSPREIQKIKRKLKEDFFELRLRRVSLAGRWTRSQHEFPCKLSCTRMTRSPYYCMKFALI